MIFNGFLQVVDDVIPEAFLHHFLAFNAVMGKPKPGHQVHVVSQPEQDGVLVLDNVGQLIPDDVRKIPACCGRFPGNRADVEALPEVGVFVGRLGILKGKKIVLQFPVNIVQDYLGAPMLLVNFLLAVDVQGAHTANHHADQCGNHFGQCLLQ
jgi:hypothetical protein